jgi:orotate phosphoribosyltransferase
MCHDLYLAELFLRAQALKVSPDEPFKLKSGNFSPVYFDSGPLMGNPSIFNAVISIMKMDITSQLRMEKSKTPLFAGIESRGSHLAHFLAMAFNVPFISLRKEPKNYGAKDYYFGAPFKDMIREALADQDVLEVVLIDDVMTDGGSKISYAPVFTEIGVRLKASYVLLDREQGGAASMQKYFGTPCFCTTTLHRIVEALVSAAPEMEQLSLYMDSPEEWHKKKGLPWINPTT